MSQMTPQRFKTLKPQFYEVPDEIVQSYLDLSVLWVDDSWPESALDPAVAAITCHLMTIDGLGTDAESGGNASGFSDFQSIKSGEVTITRYQKAASGSSYQDWLASTRCGTFYLSLLRMIRRGPRVVMGGVGRATSPYAKDSPLGWPGGWL